MMKSILGIVSLLAVQATCVASQTTASVFKVYNRLLTANPGTRYLPIYVINSPINNAENEGDKIIIFSGLLKATSNQDELATVIGHEMAHNIYSGEMDADRLGLTYMRNAGYNYCRGAQFLKKTGNGDGVHPPWKVRYKATGCL